MANKLMYIHKITPSVDKNLWLKSFNAQLNEPTYQNSLKSPKLLSQRIRKRYHKTLGTSAINSSYSPLSLRMYSVSQQAHFLIIVKRICYEIMFFS